MPQNTSSNSSLANICDLEERNLFYTRFNQFSLAPAVIIIAIFMFLKRRRKFKKNCLDGRPGIQIPVDFLGEEKNRFSYVAAYGAMANAVTYMYVRNEGVFTLAGDPFVKVFQKIVTMICFGTIFLPIFMGLSTDAKLLGSIFGFFYTFARFAGLIKRTVLCPIQPMSTFPTYPIFDDLPAQLFHFVLLVHFGVTFLKQVRSKCLKKKFACHDLLGDESDFAVGKHHVNHVKTLLRGMPRSFDDKWYVKCRNFVYEPQPHFKYSITILSCVVVAGVIIYVFLVTLGGRYVGYFQKLRKLVDNYKYYKHSTGLERYNLALKLIDIGIVSLIVSMLVAALLTYFQMYRLLVSHRDNVIKLIKGDRRFLPDKLSSPHVMVGKSPRYAGYQVAYFLWGFVFTTAILFLIAITISAAVLIIPRIINEFQAWAENVGYTILSTLLMVVFIFVVQQVLTHYVFKNRSTNSQVVDIHNRRLFLLVSFFFFFFNIMVGLFWSTLRMIIILVLNIIFIGRIDRPLIMQGFTNLDTAYGAYIGFLHLQVAHKHPVLRVFCHLLWSGMRRKQALRHQATTLDFMINAAYTNTAFNGGQEHLDTNPSRPRVSASALNKWFIAVTVIRNPTLICNRKRYLKHVSRGILNSPRLDIREGSSTQWKESQAFSQEEEISESMEQFTQTQFDDTVPLLCNT